MNVGLLFGMVVAMLTIIMILVFGFQQIRDVTDLQEDAEMKRIVGKLGVAVDRVYSMSGESSEKFTLAFPGSVEKICFVPINVYDGEQMEPYRRDKLVQQLRDIELVEDMDAARMIAGVRMPVTDNAGNYYDKEMPLLVFFKGYDVPAWYEMDHLDPSLKGSPGRILCVTPGTTVWLLRTFDSEGAWVDAEEF